MKKLFADIKRSFKTCIYFYRLAAKENKSYGFIVLLNTIVSSAAPFINILMPKYIIDELMNGQNMNRLILYILVIIFGNYIAMSGVLLLQETRKIQEDRLSGKFDLMMSGKSMSMKFEATENEKILSAKQKAETGMSWYSGGLGGMSDCVAKIGKSIFVIIGVIYIILDISPVLLLLSVLAVSINCICTSKINGASQEVFEKTPAINKFYSYIYTRITGKEYAKELRLYDGSSLVEEKSVENANALNRMDNECAIKQFKWGIPGSVMSAVSYGFSYCWLGISALQGRISVSDFVMYITAMEVFTNDCLLAIITNSQQLMMKCNFMGAFINYMELESFNAGEGPGIDMDSFDGIEFENVSFKYPGTEEYVLKNINLKIAKGEKISIVGLNGAGKSTLIKLLCRLYDVTEGTIRVCGRDIREYSYEEYIRILAVVFQDFKLFGYTLDENIRMGKNDTIKESLEDVYKISGISDWVDKIGNHGNTLIYKGFDENGTEPSGGQAQKLAIARAVYRDAPIVILDEPTAALDPVAEYEIYNRFHELVNNKTTIYISHRMSSCRFCDRIVVIGDKTIKEEGTHDNLMNKGGIYAQLFETQARWYAETCKS